MTTHAYGTNPSHAHARVGASLVSERANEPGGTADDRFDRSKGKTRERALVREVPSDRSEPDIRGIVPEEETRCLAEGFGVYLRALRKQTGLSQDQASKLCGLSVSHISKLERGLRRPGVPAVKALARILAPAGEVEVISQRLADLAGESMREGADRKKLTAENRNRRMALVDMEQHVRSVQATIRRQENAGMVVSGTLRKIADHGQAMVNKLRTDIANAKEPESIRGFTPKTPKLAPTPLPRRASQAQLRAWLDEQERNHEAFE